MTRATTRRDVDNGQVYGAAPLPTPAMAVASVIMSMGLIAIGNGLLFAFIPVKLAAEGFEPTWAGAILTGLSAGGMAGCFLTGSLVRRVGHARVFATFAATIILTNAAIAIDTDPVLWIAARSVYGFAICGIFIVAQSWLNDVVENAIRGRVTSIFYVTYIIGIGLGSFALAWIDLDGPAAPMFGIVFAALSIIPVGLTRLRPPPPPESATIQLGLAWRISPVGLVGMLAVGGMSMMVAGFAPIHAASSGLRQSEVALLMFAIPLGTLALQIPFGWLSDRVDRRLVLIAASVLVMAGGVAAGLVDGAGLVWMIAVYMVWSGATESIYSISSAHANDRADKSEMVALASTMLFAWSLSGFLIPGLATILTAVYGTQAFMHVAIAIAVVFCAFVSWRLTRARAPNQDTSTGFAPMAAQTPVATELVFSPGGEGPGPGARSGPS